MDITALSLIGIGLLVIGSIISVAGYIWFLVVAFNEHPLWGMGLLILPVALFFLILHFKKSWRPFVVSNLGAVLALVGIFLVAEMTPA